MKGTRILLVGVILGTIALCIILDLDRYLSLNYLKDQQTLFQAYFRSDPIIVLLSFFLIYVAATGLSVPGATILTLAAGALFGLWWGTLVASFATTIGATLAFLSARFLFRDVTERRFQERLAVINRGIAKDGNFYLFTLRLVPVFPFFVLNLIMGLTRMRLVPYYLVSQIGMLPATAVYANAGTHLGRLESIEDILSPTLIGSLVLMGLFPLATRKMIELVQSRRVYQGRTHPRRDIRW